MVIGRISEFNVILGLRRKKKKVMVRDRSSRTNMVKEESPARHTLMHMPISTKINFKRLNFKVINQETC